MCYPNSLSIWIDIYRDILSIIHSFLVIKHFFLFYEFSYSDRFFIYIHYWSSGSIYSSTRELDECLLLSLPLLLSDKCIIDYLYSSSLRTYLSWHASSDSFNLKRYIVCCLLLDIQIIQIFNEV